MKWGLIAGPLLFHTQNRKGTRVFNKTNAARKLRLMCAVCVCMRACKIELLLCVERWARARIWRRISERGRYIDDGQTVCVGMWILIASYGCVTIWLQGFFSLRNFEWYFMYYSVYCCHSSPQRDTNSREMQMCGCG